MIDTFVAGKGLHPFEAPDFATRCQYCLDSCGLSLERETVMHSARPLELGVQPRETPTRLTSRKLLAELFAKFGLVNSWKPHLKASVPGL